MRDVRRGAQRDGRPGAIEVTVIGSAPSAPQPDSPGSGLLIRSGGDSLLLDCGPGVTSRLARTLDPRDLSAVVITHLHADHFLDLVSLRYSLPWAGADGPRIPVHLPPGGAPRLVALAGVISEAPDFFTRALDIREYDPERPLRVGRLTVSFIPSRHYIPGWGVSIALDAGPRLVHSSDTGPNPQLADAARGADLLVVEATLGDASEDVEVRGHLTVDEAIAIARDAAVPRVLLTHLPTDRRASIRAAQAGMRPRVQVARPGLRLTLGG